MYHCEPLNLNFYFESACQRHQHTIHFPPECLSLKLDGICSFPIIPWCCSRRHPARKLVWNSIQLFNAADGNNLSWIYGTLGQIFPPPVTLKNIPGLLDSLQTFASSVFFYPLFKKKKKIFSLCFYDLMCKMERSLESSIPVRSTAAIYFSADWQESKSSRQPLRVFLLINH